MLVTIRSQHCSVSAIRVAFVIAATSMDLLIYSCSHRHALILTGPTHLTARQGFSRTTETTRNLVERFTILAALATNSYAACLMTPTVAQKVVSVCHQSFSLRVQVAGAM